MKIHRSADRYQANRPLKPWLFTLAVNTVRNYFRRRKVEAMAFSDGAIEKLESRDPGADHVVESSKTLSWLEKAIIDLPVPHREVLVLTCIEEMDQNSVSAALKIPVNTVKKNLRRARLALARARACRNAGRMS